MKKWIWLAVGVLLLALVAGVYSRNQTFVYTSSAGKTKNTEIEAPPILFIGDVMLGRHVETLQKRTNDQAYSFQKMKEYLGRHTTIANLEGPIPDEHVQTPNNGFSFSFSSSTPQILKEGGVTAVSLANNHMFDKGRRGWEETKRALDAGGIAHFGGYSPTEGDYFETTLGTSTVIVYGISMIATGWDESQALEVTRKLRREHPDAYLIAFLHWGDEYVTQNKYQQAFAHALIDNGVDAIVGTHPHVVQGIELYKGSPVIYSLGNFIFDQYWRDDLEDGLMVRIFQRNELFTYELIPIRSSGSVPDIATPSVRARILSAMAAQSDASLRSAISQGSFDVSMK